VNNIDEILSVPGVDAYFIGPNDLAASLGIKPGLDNTDPRHIAAINKVVAAGRRHNVPGGIMVANAEAVNQRILQGFKFIALASDEAFLINGASSALEKVSKNRTVS
jgi:4-hydroxy-2-oxoheptanedioate aldolase